MPDVHSEAPGGNARHGNPGNAPAGKKGRRPFGTISEAAAQAEKILTDTPVSTDGVILVAGRALLIQTFGGTGTLMPHLLPSGQLDEWCNAFGGNLVQHASTETLRQAQYRANQQRFLGSK